MATGGSAQYTAARSGGKIVTTNYRRRFKPYERPRPLPQPSRSPNWLSGLIIPAAKILSSVFNSSSSSSSSSDSDADAVYEDDANNDNDHDIPSYKVNESTLEPETSLGRMKCMSKEPGLSVEKSDRKHVIEQLIMQEMFSREECDRLVTIIKSRVAEQSSMETQANVVHSDTSMKIIDKAVMEAKKWFKERKVGQSPGSDFSREVESEIGSPVDMAKSYMKAWPLWASSSTDHIELKTPSAMKRSSLSSGAWNIQDEIRRVRSKATEDMLQQSPFSKVDMSLFSQSPQTSQKYLVTDRVVARQGDNVNELNPLLETKPIDESAVLAAGASTKLLLPALEFRQGVVAEASLSNEATCVPQQKEDSEAFQTEGKDAAPQSHHSASNGCAAEQYTDTNSGSRHGSAEKEVKEFAETRPANGHPSSQASFSAEGITGENHRHSTEENASNLSHGNSTNGIPVEDRCELLTETSVEVPVAYETDGVAPGDQSSYEELPQEENQLEGKHEGNAEGTPVKQERKRRSRRARGRGK